MNYHPENIVHSFDKAALEYDERDRNNPILQWMRKTVHGVYLRELKPSCRVLELNAGTGTDAVFMAGKGMSVFATDISAAMIDILAKKVEQYVSEGIIKHKVVSFENIGSIPENDFDAVISNFGGLNCINDFTKLSADIFEKLKPGGKFIAVVMNRMCPWEIFYYSVKFDIKNAFRRFKREGVYADLNGEKVKTFYFSPGEFSGFFKDHFKTQKIYTLGYYTPPPYLAGIYNKLKPVVKIFMKLDEMIMRLFPFNRFGDHFIIVMSRK